MPEQLELFRLPAPAADSPPRNHILLAGRIVGFALNRSRRRLALRIDERGLSVGAPRQVPLAEIEAFIRLHAMWVLEKIDAYAHRQVRRHLPIHEGASLPVLGNPAVIRITAGGNRGFWKEDELWLAARPDADLSMLVRRTLQRRALEHFRPRVAEAAARLGRPAPSLALSSARTRWGSCSSKTGIRLNWRLIHLPPATIDYVIAHEAAHLVEMNHSKRFWRVVESLCPDWQEARAALQRLGPGLPLI